MNMLAIPASEETLTTEADTSFHIAFCIDNRFFMPMGVLIESILANNPEQSFTFHIFTFDISAENEGFTKQLEKRPHIKIQRHIINPDHFSQFTNLLQNTPYSLSIFLRLIIAQEVQGMCSRILYLDADILCTGKIDKLITLDLKDNIAMVVHDAPRTAQRQIKALHLKHQVYFNSGMLLINVKPWLDNHITEKTIEILSDSSLTLSFPDQDALNIALNGRTLFLSPRWNYLCVLVAEVETRHQTLPDTTNITFIHFSGNIKPWADWISHDSVKLFKQHHARSPWQAIPLDQGPTSSREMRMKTRFLFQDKKILMGLFWYCKYLIAHSKKNKKPKK